MMSVPGSSDSRLRADSWSPSIVAIVSRSTIRRISSDGSTQRSVLQRVSRRKELVCSPRRTSVGCVAGLPDKLQQVPLFSGLNQRQLRKLARGFKERSVGPDVSLVREGQMD